jgi:hypothetical protein
MTIKENKCIDCGNDIDYRSTRCIKCNAKHCGKKFKYKLHNPNQVYCSDECRKIGIQRRRNSPETEMKEECLFQVKELDELVGLQVSEEIITMGDKEISQLNIGETKITEEIKI